MPVLWGVPDALCMIREVAYRPSKELLDGVSSSPVFRDSMTHETTELLSLEQFVKPLEVYCHVA